MNTLQVDAAAGIPDHPADLRRLVVRRSRRNGGGVRVVCDLQTSSPTSSPTSWRPRCIVRSPVTRTELPRVYDVVERLAAKQGLPMPKVYVIPSQSLNAFATGRNPQHASVAVTHGILDLLDDEELEGVLAHELGHVRNRDILTSSIAGNAGWSYHHGGPHGILGLALRRLQRS